MTIPAKQPSSATKADQSGSKKIASPTQNQAYIIKMRDITQSLLNQYFPVLKGAPNMLYIAMATWGFESSFRLLHTKGRAPNTVRDSRHLTATNPDRSFLGKDYYFSQPIQNILKSPTISQQTKENLQDGLYPHGVSACMGGYHIIGCPAYNQMFKPNQAIVSALGLGVNPGDSIRAIFTDDELGLTRSIAAGLIVYDQKYKQYLRVGNTPVNAIQKAIAGYVGKAGIPDANNFKPEQRVSQINGRPVSETERSVLGQLVAIGLTPDNTYTAAAVTRISSTPRASVSSKGAAPNDQTRTADASTESAKEKSPGCA
jgi:hypothetical protein